jgi:hypothetical protein
LFWRVTFVLQGAASSEGGELNQADAATSLTLEVTTFQSASLTASQRTEAETPRTEAETPEGPRTLPLLTDKRAQLGAGVIHDTPQGDGT